MYYTRISHHFIMRLGCIAQVTVCCMRKELGDISKMTLNRLITSLRTIINSHKSWGLSYFKNTLVHSHPCVYMYVGHSISFQTFLVQASKIVIDSWKFSILLLYILWDDWPIFRISASNEQLPQELEYTLLKPDCHSLGISKI